MTAYADRRSSGLASRIDQPVRGELVDHPADPATG